MSNETVIPAPVTARKTVIKRFGERASAVDALRGDDDCERADRDQTGVGAQRQDLTKEVCEEQKRGRRAPIRRLIGTAVARLAT